MLSRLKHLKPPRVPTLPRSVMALLWVVVFGAVVGLLWFAAHGLSVPVLEPRGEIASRQRDLLYFAVGLSLLVLLPVYYMLFTFAWRYRAGHKKSYRPDWDNDKRYETIWWGIPILIIIVLAVVTWVTSHSLDPYKSIASNQKPLKVQVVALQWKWLFIYPEEDVASVDQLIIPVNRPVEFTITSDAPMNSFWIPQLGGQVYAMSGMSTELNLIANETGIYKGVSANVSGKGFADMHFDTHAITKRSFESWLKATRDNDNHFTQKTYDELAKPGAASIQAYHVHDESIYQNAIMKYMTHEGSDTTTHDDTYQMMAHDNPEVQR